MRFFTRSILVAVSLIGIFSCFTRAIAQDCIWKANTCALWACRPGTTWDCESCVNDIPNEYGGAWVSGTKYQQPDTINCGDLYAGSLDSNNKCTTCSTWTGDNNCAGLEVTACP
jgi:hypothetical protein